MGGGFFAGFFDALRMSENLEAVAARDGYQRDAGRLGRAYGKRRRRGYGDDERCADDGGLLHHFHRNAAGQNDHAIVARHVVARQRAGKLVERIVSADILPHCNETGLRRAKMPQHARPVFEG